MQWAIGRDQNGVIIEDPKLFPQGLGAVANYIHSKGLKFGLCTRRAGEQERERGVCVLVCVCVCVLVCAGVCVCVFSFLSFFT